LYLPNSAGGAAQSVEMKGHYRKEMPKQLLFMGGTGPDKIESLLETAGLIDVAVQPLTRVVDALKNGHANGATCF
jgi:hypothetical protein